MQKIRRRKVVLGAAVIIALMVLLNCEENPNNVALEDRQGEIVIDTLYAKFDTTYILNKEVVTLTSNRLLLGQYAGHTCRMLLRFSSTDMPDSVTIDSAWIRFKTVESTGNMPVEFTAMGYPILQEWLADSSVIWNDYQSNVDFGNPLGEMQITTDDNDTVFFNFNEFGMETVRGWADTAASGIENNGLAIDFNSANFIKEFQARNSTLEIGPYLFLTFRDENDSLHTDSLLALTDVYLTSGHFEALANVNQTSTLDSPWVTILDFDLDTLNSQYPSGLIIASANLQLPVDWSNTIKHGDFNSNLELYPLTSSLTESRVAIDSSIIGIATRIVELNQFSTDSAYVEVSVAGDERKEFASIYIQRKLNFPDSYVGFYIAHKTQNDYLARYAFFKYNNPDKNRRPRLIIKSLRLPEERL